MTAQQLKNSILQMAVQGKLVPQDPNDEPASVLLERIRVEKRRLINEGKIKKDKNESVIYRVPKSDKDNSLNLPYNDQPFDIPENWEWVRLEDVSANIHYGYTASAQSVGNSRLLRITDIQNNVVKWDDVPYCAITEKEFVTYGLKNRDIMIARTGGTIGKSYIVRNLNEKSVFASYLIRVIPLDNVNEEYIKLFLETPFYWEQLKGYSMGTGQPNVNGQSLKALILPLPPLNEQYRIIAHVEKLAPYIYMYASAEQKLTALNAAFPDALKKSILQAAVQGKLVPQDPADEPASVLLERIRAEKEALIKAGKIKRDKHESVIFRRDNSYYELRDGVERCIDDELPFDIPESWTWVRLGSIGMFIRGSGIKRSQIQSKGVPCVRYGEIYTTYNIAMTSAVSFINDDLAAISKPVRFGDLLFTLTGENKEEIGKTVAFLSDERTVIGGDLATFTRHQQDPMYLSYIMNSPYAIQQKAFLGSGDIIVHISCDKLASILVPIPPRTVQHRIVESIGKLLPIIERCH